MESTTNIEEIINLISDHYSPLTENCKADFKNRAHVLSFDRPTMLVQEGQFADKIYFIVSGCARAFYLKNGKDITDWFAFENDFINSINSFYYNIPSPHYIEVMEQTTVLEFSRDSLNSMVDEHPDFDRLGRIVVTKIMLQLQQRIVSIQFETAQQKYENLLKIRPDITLKFPLSQIASYLGITLETLSRVRNPKNRI